MGGSVSALSTSTVLGGPDGVQPTNPTQIVKKFRETTATQINSTSAERTFNASGVFKSPSSQIGQLLDARG